MIYDSEKRNLTIALGGDVMLTRRLSVFKEKNFLALAKLFREADLGFANLECCVRNPAEGTPGITHGTYTSTQPELLEDIKWFGVNLLSCANNHAFDYGEGGCLATIQHLNAAGIAHAGSGSNLAEAQAPTYLDTAAGRMGMVAMTAKYRDWNRAGEQSRIMGGRPGINTIRNKTTYRVPREEIRRLQQLRSKLGFDMELKRQRAHFYSEKELPSEQADEVSFLGTQFVAANGYGIDSFADANDITDNILMIKEARRQADWVVVSFHSHDWGEKSLFIDKRSDMVHPADYMIDFAHAAIDAGADVIAGHGSHTPLGVEVYKRKPIFYSLGNLVFQNETVHTMPAEAYERFDLGPKTMPGEFNDARTDNGKKGHPAQARYWQNMAAICNFEKGNFKEIRLYPVNQGFGVPRAQRGRPTLAQGAVAKSILAHLQKVCKPFGTKTTIDKGAVVIKPPSAG